MSSRRTLILVAAIAIGALAAFAIYSYVGGLEDKANEEARTETALRVSTAIPRGTPGVNAREQAFFEEVQVPQSLITGQEIGPDEQDVINDKIAATDLVAGQILVEGMFVDPLTSRVTGADRIPDNNVAITISVDDIRGVAGLIVPGDFVNVMVTTDDICEADAAEEGGESEGEESGGSGGRLPVGGFVDPPRGVPGEEIVFGFCTPATMLYQEVQVLFVDRSPIPLPGEATAEDGEAGTADAATTVVDTGLITLAVPTDAAQLIASIPTDAFYLTLLPENYTPGPIPDFDPLRELLPGEDPLLLTPYGPEGFEPAEQP